MICDIQFYTRRIEPVVSINMQDCTMRTVNIPDYCPQCGCMISPFIISASFVLAENSAPLFVADLLCQHCNKPFIAYYDAISTSPICVAPKKPASKEFESRISNLSPTFVSIYNQALAAESFDLHDIAGIGYRKAIEHLIKDYMIMRYPDSSDKIRSEQLGATINNRITNDRLKDSVSRAVWLGNDFAHYTRKFEEYDIADMKRFIDATLHWILMELITDEASSMDRR